MTSISRKKKKTQSLSVVSTNNKENIIEILPKIKASTSVKKKKTQYLSVVSTNNKENIEILPKIKASTSGKKKKTQSLSVVSTNNKENIEILPKVKASTSGKQSNQKSITQKNEKDKPLFDDENELKIFNKTNLRSYGKKINKLTVLKERKNVPFNESFNTKPTALTSGKQRLCRYVRNKSTHQNTSWKTRKRQSKEKENTRSSLQFSESFKNAEDAGNTSTEITDSSFVKSNSQVYGLFDCSLQIFLEGKSINSRCTDYSFQKNSSFEDSLFFKFQTPNPRSSSSLMLKKQIHNLIEELKSCKSSEENCQVISKIILCCVKESFNSILDEIVPEIIDALRELELDSMLSLYCSMLVYYITRKKLIPNDMNLLIIIVKLLQMDKVSSFEKLQSSNFHLSDETGLRELVVEYENLDVISHYTASDFAVECLLKFVQDSQDEWYKKKLRQLGALDLIMDTVKYQSSNLWNEELTSSGQIYKTTKMERCLNILQNAIFKNPENQAYVLNYENATLLQSTVRVLQFCRRKLFQQNFTKIPESIYTLCLSSVLKLLINITHENVQCSVTIGDYGAVMDIVLFCIISLPYLRNKFDIMLLLLGVVANLVTMSKNNLFKFVSTRVTSPSSSPECENEVNAIEALTEVYENVHEEMQNAEVSTEKLISMCALQSSSRTESFDHNVSAVFKSADHHMEQTMICAHIALILGYVIEDNPKSALIIKEKLTNSEFNEMANTLKEFQDFIHLTNLLDDNGLQDIQRIVDVLSSVQN